MNSRNSWKGSCDSVFWVIQEISSNSILDKWLSSLCFKNSSESILMERDENGQVWPEISRYWICLALRRAVVKKWVWIYSESRSFLFRVRIEKPEIPPIAQCSRIAAFEPFACRKSIKEWNLKQISRSKTLKWRCDVPDSLCNINKSL